MQNKNAISHICEGLEIHNEKIEPNIVVSMTSWPKRINQVCDTIKTILDNNMKPDKICINLSTEEFPNKEKDLPDNLNKLIQTNKIIEINWLKHNTSVWKKFIPTLIKYKKSKVICIDDDRLYPKNFIETFYKASLKYPNNPLSSANIKLYNNLITHCGHGSLNMYDFYKKRLYDLTFDMMELKSSDAFYTILADKCNHPLIYVGEDFHRLVKERPNTKANTKDGYSNTNKLVGQKIQNIFKYLNEKISKIPEYMNNKFIDTNTKYILLPTNKPTKYLDMYRKIKSEFIQNNEKFIDINDFKNDLIYYSTYNLNWHHFTLKTHYDIIIPKMNELLNFGYDKNDFELIPYFDENPNTKEKYDLSYLYPKKEYNFSIQHNGNIETGNFDLLLGFKSNIKYGPEITKYHKMYRYPHETSLIINNSINSNRILLLSGDSTNIPQIPILACYFKQILYLDTRTLHGGIDFNNIQFTDTLLSLFNMYPISKYLVDNFRI